MAAGDIILSNGTTITAAEIQQIAAEVKKSLAAESKELSQFEEVTSLANVSSLPGIQQSGATLKLVRVALEVLKGVDGKNIELTASQTAIQWRNVGDSTWNTLVDLSLLKGSKGDKGDKGDTGEKGDTGATGATGAKGDPGEKVMLRKGASGIEWKYEDDASWQTLVPMADLSFTFEELTDEQKQEISRKPILGTVEATKGDTPSGSFTEDGTDDHGNPKYKLNLVLPKGDKGDKGEPPVIEQGTVTTGNPGTEASVEVVPNGETDEGNPKYILNFTIPAGKPGQDGTGSGNVYVAETGLVSGKKYLFQPGANGSANGTFVEYVEPTIPEQVQPDWNATEGKGAILNKPTILPDAPKDGKQYARKDGAWEEVEAGDELSKAAIEQVLTGNITTHRHDTNYNYTDFETDVWDGTSISTSLQGSGTKDDPYLIQSCADWLHLRASTTQYGVYTDSDLGNATEFKPYFKITKNLDFGNKAIPEVSTTGDITPLLICEFDGNRAKLSNFVDSEGIGILPPSAYYFAHDFVIDNLHTTADASNGYAAIFSTQDLYSAILNCTVNASVTLTGSIVNPGLNQLPIIVSGEYPLLMSNEFMTEINSYVENNGCCCGINISITDNTTKSNDAKIVAVFSTYFMLHPIDLYCSVPLDDVNVFGEELPQKDFTVTIMLVGSQPACLYTNSEGTNKINGQDIENQTFTFTGTPKSLTEMQSAAFVDELNSHLPKPAFRQDPDGGTPILAGGNATIAYDGYVKKSEFESFKQNMPTSTVKPNDFIYELKPDVYVLTDNTPSEDISAAIGGEEGMKAIIQAIKDGYRFVIRGTLESFTIGTINTELNVWFYKETDSGDLHVGFYGIAAYMFGGVASNIAISYTKSSSTFKVEIITA